MDVVARELSAVGPNSSIRRKKNTFRVMVCAHVGWWWSRVPLGNGCHERSRDASEPSVLLDATSTFHGSIQVPGAGNKHLLSSVNI